MQRRATALWAAFFIVLSLASYAYIGVAEEPAIVQDPDYSFSSGASAEIAGEQYTFEDGSLTFTNESARASETFENGSELTYRNATYVVHIPNETDPSSFTLWRALPDDVQTATVNETEYVVVDQDGERTLIEPKAYLVDRFGANASFTFASGDQLTYDDETTDVRSVTADGVTLAWDDPQDESISLSEGEQVTLGDTTYVAHFPSEERLLLTDDVATYEDRVALQDSYRERVNGLWAVAIMSVLSTILLIGLSYMPSRY